MTLINFHGLISELSEESFERVKFRIAPYLNFYFIDEENADKNLVIEKIGEFLRNLELKTGKRDHDLADIYISYLYKYVDNRINYSTRAYRYFKKAQRIKSGISRLSEEELVQNLEDFTKIFVCLYSEYINNKKNPVSDINFYLSEVDLDSILKNLESDTPQMVPLKKMAPKVLRDIVPKDVFKNVDDAREAMSKVNVPNIIPGKKKKMDDLYEPIHDVIEMEEINERYDAKAFVSILLPILYRRLLDFECGLQ